MPPTPPNARTGEFTPPGITRVARSNRASLRPVRVTGRLRRGVGDAVEVLGGERVQVGRPGQLRQLVAVPNLGQGGGHRRVGQGEPEQGLVEGPAPVPLQELQPGPGGGVQARGQWVTDDQAGPGLGGQRGQVPPRHLLGHVVDGLDGRDPPLTERGRTLVGPALPGAEDPVVADLALLHLRLQQLEQLVELDGVHSRVVQQPQVDRLKAQPLQ